MNDIIKSIAIALLTSLVTFFGTLKAVESSLEVNMGWIKQTIAAIDTRVTYLEHAKR